MPWVAVPLGLSGIAGLFLSWACPCPSSPTLLPSSCALQATSSPTGFSSHAASYRKSSLTAWMGFSALSHLVSHTVPGAVHDSQTHSSLRQKLFCPPGPSCSCLGCGEAAWTLSPQPGPTPPLPVGVPQLLPLSCVVTESWDP